MKRNNDLLWKYAGFATQLIILLGTSIFLGIYLDKKFSFTLPLLVWILPLLVILLLIYKAIKDTNIKK